MSRAQPHILLIQLEFPNWKQARAWAYPACFGVAEGLRAQGVSCTTIPVMANAPFSTQTWLAHAQQAVAGQQFDQVWVWLVHAPLDPNVLEWITGLAPVRVGIVMESLAYDEEDYAWAGHLRARQGLVENQLRAFTHALLPDECDVQNLAGRLTIQSLWWPTMVPARFIAFPDRPAVHRRGVFHGEPYGPRRQWVTHQSLQNHLNFVRPAAPQSYPQQLFDQLQTTIAQRLSSHIPMTRIQMADYAGTLQQIREAEFTDWMAHLPQWAAIVNLPSLAKFFGGRVYEGIAAGRPVLSYAVPHHPLNNALFIEGEEILFFSPENPDSLRDQVDRVIRDEAFAATIARNAQRKLRAYHTSEHRIAQTLRWIESGQQPDYGVGASFGSAAAGNNHAVPFKALSKPDISSDTDTEGFHSSSPMASTTVFVLTVEDPVFQSCVEALGKQDGPLFKQDIIRNVSPFSAAAQEMITRCTTPYFIQVDEDMILNPNAVAAMTAAIEAAPDDVGMICFHLHDDDRDLKIQGVKIYRASLMRGLSFQDLKASEMDLLDQMGRRGIKWILHSDVVGRHGTQYSIESIYLRYKSMYEKDIRVWNTVTWDLRRKAESFLKTGDVLQLFALLGAAHGIINAPQAQDREKDAKKYDLKELDIFKQLLVGTPPVSMPYDANDRAETMPNPPIPMEQVRWKHTGASSEQGLHTHLVARPDALVSARGDLRTGAKADRSRVLLATPLFWPSIGGAETIVENLGVELLKQGYAVDVATIALTERTQCMYRGMKLLSLTCPSAADVTPRYTAELYALVMSGHYEACIMICSAIHPFIYSLMNAEIPASTRVLIQPIINKQSCEVFAAYPNAQRKLGELLRSATGALVLTRQGLDAQLMREAGITPVYLPNATEPIASSGDFRTEHGIPRDAFVVLHVANLWEVKNHLGLLHALQRLPDGMRLVMIGHATTDEAYGLSVRQELAKRSDVLYIPGLPPEKVATAIQAADVVILASHAEAAPVSILEAMSHRKPWLATPDCGAVVEHAGGIVTPLHNFLPILLLLQQQPELQQALADMGYEHWRSSYSWTETIKGWVDLIETGRLQRSFDMPDHLVRRMKVLREKIGCGWHASQTDVAVPQRPVISDHVQHGVPPMLSPRDSHHASDSSTSQAQSNEFYTNLFVKSAYWSTPHPNPDEAARWSKIAAFLEYLLRRVRQTDPDRQLRMLDVGCGRGWLTNLATMYGSCEGIEPVADVIEHARRLFPHLRFEAGTAQSVLQRPDFAPYDVVLCSEVIEHVPHGQKEAFVAHLATLLKPDGFLILTTPRGEMWEQWKAIAPPNQPVEDWVTEEQLRGIFTTQGLCELGLERVHVEIPSLRYIPAPTPADLTTLKLVPIYQIWACQRVQGTPVAAFTRPPMVSVIVPTYNRPDRLREAVSSILAQTYQDFEIIVVNDGTSDVTEVIAALNTDGRITCIRHDRNRGLAAARNTGIRAAKGKYVAYLDDDDRYLPDHLETLVTFLERTGCKAAYTDAWRVHEKCEQGRYQEVGRDLPYSYDFNPANLLVSNYFPVLCVMHERHCLDDVGIFDESLFAHEDWDLWIRMATKYPFVHISHTTAEFTWRGDGSSMTSRDQDVYLRTTEIIYRKYAPYVVNHAAIREAQRNHLRGLLDRQAKQAPPVFTCSIIIPVWNKVDLTRQCLEALAATTMDISFEVIVVDNGSTDETQQFLSALGGDVRVITNEKNMGFAKACNQGAAVATGDHLVFLNNDTIPLNGWLTALVEEVKAHPEVAIVGSKLLYQDRTVQHAGVAVDRLNLTPYHIYRGFADTHPAVNKRRELNAVTAACLLIRRQAFTEVGGFDEGFLNGFEDVDLCFKVREKKGRIVYQPRSVLFHLESQTPGRKQHDAENGQRLIERWGRCWWLVDDDSIYCDDGYKVAVQEHNGQLVPNLQLIDTDQERRAWELVAATQQAAQQRDEAMMALHLSKCAEWPADRWVLKWAATVADAIKQPALAAAFQRRVTMLDDPAVDQIVVIREALSKGQVTTAASRLESLLKHYPSHAEGLLLRAILQMQQEQYRDAEIAFTTALNQGADRRKCLMGIGMASMGRAYPQGAWQTFLRVLAENPDDAEVIHWLLRAGTAQNRWQELSVQLRNYLARNPSDISARFAYASVLLRAEQIEAARQEHSQLEALAPEHEGMRELGQAIAGKEAEMVMGVSNA